MKPLLVTGDNKKGISTEECTALIKNGRFEYSLKESRRTRRIRISVLPGRVSVTAPPGIPVKTLDSFVRSKSSWILEKLALFEKHPGPSAVFRAEPGGEVWLFGDKHIIRTNNGTDHFSVADGELLLGNKWFNEKRFRKLLDDLLMGRILPTVGAFSSSTGIEPERIRLGNARTRWGSCSPSGVVMINRKLVHAPCSIVDYIVLHELMHLRHRNHSSLFWKDLCSVMPGVPEARRWLRFQGAHLL